MNRSMRSVSYAALVALLFAGCTASAPARSPDAGASSGRTSHLIPVPFVSFAEAAALDYEQKSILNPTLAAAVAMVLKHGDQDLSMLRSFSEALPERGGWATVKRGPKGTLEGLRNFIDRGVLVIVTPTTTDIAHPPGPVLDMLATMKGAKPRKLVPTSGALLPMRSLDELRGIKRSLGEMFSWESLLIHARVVVGYDDTRQVFILHDPVFGPEVEVSYEQFDRMWAPVDRWFTAVEPRSPAASLPGATRRPRSAAEIAVEEFVYGYALESLGRFDAADSVLRRAAASDSVPSALRYLLVNELAHVAWNRGRHDEALRLAEEATALAPESPSPWSLRAEIAKSSNDAEAARRRANAEAEVKRLCSDRNGLTALQTRLAQHLMLWAIGCPQPPIGGPANRPRPDGGPTRAPGARTP